MRECRNKFEPRPLAARNQEEGMWSASYERASPTPGNSDGVLVFVESAPEVGAICSSRDHCRSMLLRLFPIRSLNARIAIGKDEAGGDLSIGDQWRFHDDGQQVDRRMNSGPDCHRFARYSEPARKQARPKIEPLFDARN